MTQATDQARLTQLAASTGPVECLVPNAGNALLADGLDLAPKKDCATLWERACSR